MKKFIALALIGSLAVGSTGLIFAQEDPHSEVDSSESPIVQVLEGLQEDDDIKISIESLKEILKQIEDQISFNLDELELEGEELEAYLANLLEEILLVIEPDLALDDKDQDSSTEAEDENDDDAEDELKLDDEALTDLYLKLAKFEQVYDRVPAPAKPAIEKNMKMIQLRILRHLVENNEDPSLLFQIQETESLEAKLADYEKSLAEDELTEEELQELREKIEAINKELQDIQEANAVVETIQGNDNWYQEMRRTVHHEFKEQKKILKDIRKGNLTVEADAFSLTEESDESKMENEEDVAVSEEKVETIENVTNQKSHPVKEIHPGRGNGIGNTKGNSNENKNTRGNSGK